MNQKIILILILSYLLTDTSLKKNNKSIEGNNELNTVLETDNLSVKELSELVVNLNNQNEILLEENKNLKEENKNLKDEHKKFKKSEDKNNGFIFNNEDKKLKTDIKKNKD